MNKSLYIFFCFVFMLNAGKMLAQNQETQIENILESITENLNEESNTAQIIEDLQFFAENKININQTSASELSRLHLLNDIQIEKILAYIRQFGPAYSIFELNAIYELNPDILQKIEPFVWFGPSEKIQKSFSEEIKSGKHEVLMRTLGTIQKADGYKIREDGSAPFEGNRFRYYTRYRFQSSGNLSFGITAEKDPGEAFFSKSNKYGFDFYSGHVRFSVNPVFEKIIVGDYMVRSGQGLILWQGYSFGKSGSTNHIYKTNQGIRPYTSTDENRFFRGIAGTIKLGQTKLDLFYSQQKNDANVVIPDSAAIHFTSLQISGYHRTINEILDKNSVINKNLGVIARRTFNNLKIGITSHYQHFNLPFKRKNQAYNLFRFAGDENVNLGVDYQYNKNKYLLFGEAAVSKSKGKAFLQGMVVHLDDRFIYSAQFRKFDKNYHALWGNAFSEQSIVNDETGFYFGTQIIPFPKATIRAYADFYSWEWIKYATAAPSNGYDIFFQMNYTFSEKANMYFRFKNEKRDDKISENSRYVNLPQQIKKTRFHFEYSPTEKVTLKSRIEHSYFSQSGKEKGWLAFQDFNIKASKIPAQLNARLAWFNTDGYNSRIYAYENDLLYLFSIPAYFEKGMKAYINVKYAFNRKLSAWIKFENTYWPKRDFISSGYNRIEGKNKTALKFQLRLKI